MVDGSGFRIQPNQPVHETGEIDDDAGPHRRAAQSAAGAPPVNGKPLPARKRHRGRHVGAAFRVDDRRRLHPVDTAVGGEHAAVQRFGVHFAVDGALQLREGRAAIRMVWLWRFHGHEYRKPNFRTCVRPCQPSGGVDTIAGLSQRLTDRHKEAIRKLFERIVTTTAVEIP